MTPLDLEVALIRVGVEATRIINVSVDDGDVGESLCRNLIQPPADLKPEGGIAGRRVFEYVRSINLDNFHHLEKISEISEG